MTFFDKIRAKWSQGKFLCVGLDTDINKLPNRITIPADSSGTAIVAYNKAIVDAVADTVCAFKPNIAFYEAIGAEGFSALEETIDYIKVIYPDVAVILDCKRGDIGNTNAGYITAAFDLLNADAVTVSPYLGQEAMQPFLDRKDKGIFVLCRTSNTGADEFQDLPVVIGMGGRLTAPLYQIVAAKVAQSWNKNGNCGLVIGATAPEAFERVRHNVPDAEDIPILIPGIGAQGGSLKESVLAARDSRNQGVIVNISREIIYASAGEDFAQAARAVALARSDEIRNILKAA